jgi:hypothetical protein
MGLCPPAGARLDGGGTYAPSPLQAKVWDHWTEFWDVWVPRATQGEPYILVVNGDALDGVHHNSTTQISHNLADQHEIAYECLREPVSRAAAYYHIRGTEAHVGKSGAEEERLAQRLGALPDHLGNHARWELWLDLHGHLCHFTHHIGTSGSSSYEATAVGKEMVENYVESGRWGYDAAQVLVRSHRHRFSEVRMYGAKGLQISTVTPAWQLKTPYTFKIAGARVSPPQMGGIIIRAGEEELYTRACVWPIERPATEVYGA